MSIVSPGPDKKVESTEPPDTWTVRPVVWEDGGGDPRLLPDRWT